MVLPEEQAVELQDHRGRSNTADYSSCPAAVAEDALTNYPARHHGRLFRLDGRTRMTVAVAALAVPGNKAPASANMVVSEYHGHHL